MDYEIRKFDALTASTDEWNSYHVFRKKRHMELTPDDPINPDEMIEIARKQEAKDDQSYSEHYVVYNNDSIIGSLGFGMLTDKNPSYSGNEHICQFSIAILPEYRRQRIGMELFNKLVNFADTHGKASLLTNTSEHSGKKFLEKMGFSSALAGRENRLVLSRVDWDKMNLWVEEGFKRSPESKMMFFETVPEDIIDPYSKIYTETLNQQPLGDLDVSDFVLNPEALRKREKEFKELSIFPMTAITLEANGDISGLTELIYNGNTRKILMQGLTGVKDEYRGRGLGKWLKSALLLKMREKYPEITTIKTGNAESNAPMLSINERMGFEVFKEDILGQIKTEEAKKNLDKLKVVESMLSA